MSYLFRATVTTAAIATSLAVAQTPVTGVRARATPADYSVSRDAGGTTYAVSLLPADRVRHLFGVDISKSYIVFEVACYPSQTGSVAIDPNNFLLKPRNVSEILRPTDAATVAAVIQDKTTPRRSDHAPVDIVTSVGVGYESGTDPYTGRPVHGTYTDASVGVGTGRGNYPPPPPRPGSTPQDRVALEGQLADKAFPQGTFTHPVAGLLYFPADVAKKAKGNYDLQYLSDDSTEVDLPIEGKSR